jgi:hypothetical protein
MSSTQCHEVICGLSSLERFTNLFHSSVSQDRQCTCDIRNIAACLPNHCGIGNAAVRSGCVVELHITLSSVKILRVV